MTNQEWVELLSKELNVSHTVAKVMLHKLYDIKKSDDFRKEIQGRHLELNKDNTFSVK